MAKKKKQDGSHPAGGVVALPIEWNIPREIIARYANQVVIQMGQHDCSIAFFEARPPIVSGTKEDVQRQLGKRRSIPADCVGRIIMPIAFLPAFIQLLNDTYEQQIGDLAADDAASDPAATESEQSDQEA